MPRCIGHHVHRQVMGRVDVHQTWPAVRSAQIKLSNAIEHSAARLASGMLQYGDMTMRIQTRVAAVVLATLTAMSGTELAAQMQHRGMGPGAGSGSGMMGGGMMGGGMMAMGRGECAMMGEDGATHTAGRIAFLKAELAISDAQLPAFEAYTAALKNSLENMGAMHSSTMAAKETASPVDRLGAHVAAMKARLKVLKELQPALATLYGSLSADQKTKANQIMTGMGCMQ